MAQASAGRTVKRRGRRRFWLVVLLLLALGAAAYAYVARPWEPRLATVRAETVAPGAVSQMLAVNGRVVPVNQVTVQSLVSGQALEVAVDEGDAVDAGTVLLRLDGAQAQARVDQARAALDAGTVREQQAKANADRAEALGENLTRSAREDAALALTEAQNEVQRLRFALQQAESELAQYTIAAPIAGVVLKRSVERGQLVGPQADLFTVADIGMLLVDTEVDELYSSRIREGLKVYLRPVGESVARLGTVVFAAPRVDAETGGRVVQIAFDEPPQVPVGLTVNANIVVAEFDGVLSLPRSAIVTENAESHVFVVEGGVVRERRVAFSDWPAERVVVTEGLAAGDVVVLDPASVADGQQVEVAQP